MTAKKILVSAIVGLFLGTVVGVCEAKPLIKDDCITVVTYDNRPDGSQVIRVQKLCEKTEKKGTK